MTDRRDGDSLADQLTKLVALRDSGALTPAEFETAKQRVFGGAEGGAAPPTGGMESLKKGTLEPIEPISTTELIPDIPPGELTLGGLHGEDDDPEPPPPIPREPPETVGTGPGSDPASDPPLETGSDFPPESVLGATDERGLSLERKPAAEPDAMPPAGAPVHPYADRGAPQRLALKKPGGLAHRTPWMIGGGVVVLLILSVSLVLYVNGSTSQRRTQQDRGPSSPSTPGNPPGIKDGGRDDVGSQSRGRAVRWRPAGAFTCAALQERVDDCEDAWADQLRQVLRRTRIGAHTARISVDRPRVAVKQAQTLVFENGELHRCQVAMKRKMPVETQWLSAVKKCLVAKRCEPFAACHAKVFLRYIAQIPFSCRFYCNKEMYQCGAAMVGSGLNKSRGFKVRVDEDRLDKFRPKLFARCLSYCKKNLKTPTKREAVLQCMFQPTCQGFVACLEKIPD